MCRTKLLILGTVMWYSLVVPVIGLEDSVLPQLARAAVPYLIRKYHPEEYELGYDVRISEPRIYYDYSGVRKYYAIYAYFGPGDMPSWETIEKDPDAYFEETNMFRSFIIPADKKEFFDTIGKPTIPLTLHSHKKAEKKLREREPLGAWKYQRTIIATDRVYFVFVKGNKEIIVTTGGSVIDPQELPYLEPSLHDFSIWNEVEEYLRNSNFQGKASQLDSGGYQPSGWEADMPHYWQEGGTPPNGNWGCSSTSTADFLGFYSGIAGYDWKGCPHSKNQWQNQTYGDWILRGNSSDGIYYRYKKRGNVYDMTPMRMCDGLGDWVNEYSPTYRSKFKRHYGNKGWNPIDNWATVKEWLNDHNGFVLAQWPTSGAGHCFAIFGWKEENNHHFLIGWDPAYQSKNAAKSEFELEVWSGYSWGMLHCSNPTHGGGNRPPVSALEFSVFEDRILFTWNQENGGGVEGYYIVSFTDRKDSGKAIKRVATVPLESGEQLEYVIDIQNNGFDNADFYLEILRESGHIESRGFIRKE
jgi:hypothetical protein